MEHLRTGEGGVRWKETERRKKRERLSVSCRVMGTERKRVANIIELKRWSEDISKQVGVWSVRNSRRDINF